ncbi:MAG: VCBS repeat-containing protein [Deltaproteobacteria bacterium]|nr:VCBS repeat-containing protein [Deltaproteobacteria bacterium]
MAGRIHWAIVLVGGMAAACGGGGGAGRNCTRQEDCGVGEVCLEGRCVGVPDGGEVCEGSDVATEGGDDGEGEGEAEGEGGEDGGGEVLACEAGDVCQDDMRCVGGVCVSWEEGAFDPGCLRAAVPGPVRPQLQCSWDAPPATDAVPTYTHVLHTPLVANLGIHVAPDVPTRPNVIFISDATYYEGPPRGCGAAGTLRVIDGATCAELAAATDEADRVNSPVTPAVGDIDADGAVEVVAAGAAGGLLAFRWNEATGRIERIWQSHLADGTADLQGWDQCIWSGVTLADLDDDGRAEIVFEGGVWGADGTRISTVPGWPTLSTGFPAVVADVDLDTVPELVAGEATWDWDDATRSFVPVAYWAGPGQRGWTALADFGDFPAGAGDAPGRPEVVAVYGGAITVLSVGGTVLGSATSGSFGGGPPTIADYDGDGSPEIGAAFGGFYVVYDFLAGGVSWSRESQDLSSSRTGSSVFDFNGDGRAEVVYGDECYVRVYDGQTGEVVFSQARFSSTWEENPIVADVDADFAAEMVMGMSGDCVPSYCPPWDPLFAGLRCDAAADCPGGGTCDDGLCRCTTDAECGATYGCTDPLAGTAGSGQVCRARHLDCRPGLRIYRDAHDRWASSRAIWNQHAYSVTNVEDDGGIPATSAWTRNWETAGLNNFRQNVQGSLSDVPGPDFTVGGLVAVCEGADTRIRAEVCNRGGALIDSGVIVIFRQAGGEELCRLTTPDPVPPGLCTPVECVAPVQADGVFEALADPDGVVSECVEGNNGASGWADCLM